MKLKLHIGHGKTGSSYLQSWFACNSQLLFENYSIFYPGDHKHAEKGHFSMGNRKELDEIIESRWPRRWIQENLPQFSEKRLIPNTLFFSFEGLTRQFSVYRNKIVRSAELLGISDIDVLLIVRDPLDHACSVYNQMVKRHGYFGSIDEWLEVYDFTDHLLQTIQELSENTDLWNLRIEHYDKVSTSLSDLAKDWLNIPTSSFYNQTPNFIVNRSLTHEELCLMRIVNKKLSVDKSRLLGERLVNQFPESISSNPKPSASSSRRFVDKWNEKVETINSLIPKGARLHLDASTFHREKEESDFINLSRQHIDCIIDCLAD